MAASLRALRTLRAGQQHVVGGVAAAIRRSRADLLRVEAGVSVHGLLVDQTVGGIFSPVRTRLTIVASIVVLLLVALLGRRGLDEDRHCDLVT